MEHSALVQSNPVPYRQVARPLHTVIALSALAVWVLWSCILADQMRVSINLHRMRFYLHGLVLE